MPDLFLSLSPDDRREALSVASAASGRAVHLLEKDVWLVWILEVLFGAPFAGHLVFKGGSSLSKGYRIIDRFSEDVDLTYDIRALVPDLAGTAAEPVPTNRSQEKKWTQAVRSRLPEWIAANVVPALETAISTAGLPARVTVEGDKAFVEYDPVASGTGYTRPTVLLEFDARSTSEPCEFRVVSCDAERHLQNVAFPKALARVMIPERTFWEKATAIHVFCHQGQFRGGDRFARHWHDLVRLDHAGAVDEAIADSNLALAVARHKSVFFAEKDSSGAPIDYRAAVTGGLRLVPAEDRLEALETDYEQMIEDGLLADDAESFALVIDDCASIEYRANRGKAFTA